MMFSAFALQHSSRRAGYAPSATCKQCVIQVCLQVFRVQGLEGLALNGCSEGLGLSTLLFLLIVSITASCDAQENRRLLSGRDPTNHLPLV